MSRTRISQREARRWKKRAEFAEEQINEQRITWGGECPGGVNIASVSWDDPCATVAKVKTARKLGHAVVVRHSDDEKTLWFYGLPLGAP